MPKTRKRNVLILGAAGFIGSNIASILSDENVYRYSREIDQIDDQSEFDMVINCVGCNRSDNPADYMSSNVEFLESVFKRLKGKAVHQFVNLSSIQAGSDDLYGETKLQGERVCEMHCNALGANFTNLRLPGVFGPGMRPNYNSVIATWCHHAIEGRAIEILDPAKTLTLTHITTVVTALRNILDGKPYDIKVFAPTLASIAEKIFTYHRFQANIFLYEPEDEFDRFLFSCYVSYLNPSSAIANLVSHSDERGSFTELFKLAKAGQISVSVTPPNSGVRGNHFHSAKLERFFVVQGRALVRNRNILTDEFSELTLSADQPRTFMTIPNWTHSVENISDVDLIMIIWANELFDATKPDTVSQTVVL